MRILKTTPVYPPFMGGNGILVKELAEYLSIRDCKVTVLTTNASSIQGFRDENDRFPNLGKTIEDGVKVVRLPINEHIPKLIDGISRLRGGWRILKLIPGEWREIRNMEPAASGFFWRTLFSFADCIVGVNIYLVPAYYAALAARLRRTPFIMIPLIHTEAHGEIKPIAYRLLHLTDAIIALTEHEKSYLESRGIDGKKIYVIGVGTNAYKKALLEKDDKPTENIVVGFVGRPGPGKGLDHLILAMKKVWTEIPATKLVIAGPKPRQDDILDDALNYLTAEERANVTCIHDFPEEEKSSIFGSLDIFAMPSIVESFGIAYLEAWSHQLPVIGCLEGASSSLIDHGVDGLLTNYGDSDRLASALLRLAKQPELRATFGKNGRRKVIDKYRWEIIAEQVLVLCKNISRRNSNNILRNHQPIVQYRKSRKKIVTNVNQD